MNAVSTLTLNPEKEDNGITYQCQVSHPALSSPLTIGITLNVLCKSNLSVPHVTFCVVIYTAQALRN